MEIRTLSLLVATTLSVCGLSGQLPREPHIASDIRPQESVTQHTLLSAYLPSLEGTPADTDVFILQGERPGPTALILGGTHMDEPAALLATIVIVESARVMEGRLIVVPVANSLATLTSQRLTVIGASGERTFFTGQRNTGTRFQYPDPPRYVSPAGVDLHGQESRNLNRVWPGRESGSPTERIAHAFTTLMRTERVSIGFDLHEATNEASELAWTLAGRSKVAPIIQDAVQRMNSVIGRDLMRSRIDDEKGGLSRTEWPVSTGVLTFLTETPRTGVRLEERVGVQLENIRQTIEAWNATSNVGRITFSAFPGYPELTSGGFPATLR
jgi:hypothetical protein